MTKAELEKRIVELEKQVKNLQFALNNCVQPQPAPVYVWPTTIPSNVWYGAQPGDTINVRP